MKTKITITIDTKFKKHWRLEEDNTKGETITKELEEQFHKFLENQVSMLLIEDLDEEYIDSFMDYTDCYFEGYDSFSNYGKIKIEMTTQNLDEKEKKKGFMKNEN